ncbi:MAG: hypothetical protein JWM14_3153 [Chitinophagaceae bacterium]|nr:hypothetical protein [Chitinophagaceae bacterium]
MINFNCLSFNVKFLFALVLTFFFSTSIVSAQCNVTVSPNASSYGCYTTLEDVVWSSLANAAASSTDLSRTTAGGAWNAGAFSTASVYNNGYVETVVNETNTARAIGLSNTNPDANITSIVFGIYLRSDGTFEVYESNASRGNYGTYNTGDTIRIKVERGKVKYYRNSVLVYNSAVTPTLPLFVDASLNTTASTLKKVVISNLSNGSFKATASSLGTGPSYQWKLNGTNVGTGATYSNTTLALNDVLTCVFTAGTGGCTPSPATSNNVKIKFKTTYNFGDFYISTTPATSGCSEAVAQVVWDSLSTGLNVSGNSLTRIQNTNAWDGGAASLNTVSNNGYFQFTALETTKLRAAGLSTTNANANYTSIQYAFYLNTGGVLTIQESGTAKGPTGTYTTGDLLKIAVEAGVVKYYQNGNLLYISATAPTLPLLVDVSINNTGGTINNALVSNYTAGVFNAVATSAGTAPTYQWMLNGGNVGTGSTYSNSALAPSDLVTCVLTPNLNGCSTSSYPSNTITYKTNAPSANIEFYIQGTAAVTACAAVEEQVKWKVSDLLNLQASSNNLTKIQSNGNWDGGAASYNTVNNNGYFQFTATETNTSRVVGLSSSNTNATNATVQYGFYLVNTGVLQIIETNVGKGTFGSYATNDVLKIAVEANVVKYYRNGTLLYISATAPTLPMLVDVSINTLSGTVTNALVGNYNTGTFTATALNAGVAPVYQWKLNGINAGTNSSTYTNTALAANDVVTCVLTPDLVGCTSAAYASNSLTNKTISSPGNVEFYIQGTPATSACFSGEEQVRWKISDLNYVIATGNNLSKFQSNGNWDGGAASWNTVANNGYFQFAATETNTLRAAGLSTTNVNSNFTSIQYAFYLTAAGNVQIQESGTNRGTFSTYISGDVFKVAVESSVVKYYQNGNLLYISTVAPLLPLIADVSINASGGTITNALIGNFSSGTYTATAINAGASPTYQWQINSSNVGTSTATYSNTSLSPGDVVSCMIKPSTPGCTATPINSNTIVNKTVTNATNIEFYIQGLVAVSGCNSPEEQVRWKNADLNFVQANNNNLVKVQSDGNWDGGAASWNTVSNNGYFQFTATEVNKARMIGLSTTNTNANYTSIQYAFYLKNNGNLNIFESSTDKGLFSTYTTNDVFKILVDNNIVKYYQNGNLLYTSTVAPTLPLLVDVSINATGGTVTNAVVANYNIGSFAATVTNAGVSPSYQWQVNGAPVGTNSATYTHVSLNNNDIVTCILTPSLPGCGITSYTSNGITNKSVSTPATIDFFIQGTVVTAACNTAEEQVKWKTSDFNYVVVTSVNNLSKVQSNNSWDGGAASWSTVGDNGYFQFTATEVNTFRAAGLSTANANNNYTSIQYAFYLTNSGTVQITESGTNRGTFGTYSPNDVFAIKVESSVVKYYQNGTLLLISNNAPTLPLLVDVSLYTLGATITNPIVSNYNAGRFTASATNAGASPNYQWKLNGVNTGTNSAIYTSATLALNDVVTCVLNPNLAGCSNAFYTSNIVTNKPITTGSNIEFYVQGTVATTACNTSDEDVVWKISDLTNVQASGGTLTKVQSDGNWDGGAASWNTVANNGYLQFTASETNKARMIGLSTSNASSSYTTIQYAFYLQNNGTVNIYENGNNKLGVGIYSTGDIFKIIVDNNVIKYYQNGNLAYTSTAPPTLPMLVDVSIKETTGTLTNVIVSNYNAGTFTAAATNVGVSPVYQWKLNGVNTGTNSTTYTNTTLNNNDVVSCVVTPNIAGCTGTQIASNNIVNRSIATPTNLEFYIQATVAVSGCGIGEEQVRWKNSDYNFVTGSSNNLLKVQSDGNWDGGAASWNTVANNGYFQFTATETSESRMAGLSTTNTSSNYTTIQYAFYLINTGSLKIYESGTDRGTYGTYTMNDVFRIAVEAGVVKYYQNGNLLYISVVAPTLPMLVDVSIRDVNGTITNAVVGNYSSGVFTATSINAGVSPSYQWKVNGVNSGTNSATYTNAALSINDVVTCDLTPNIPGCGTTIYSSNSITNKSNSASSSIEFYIQGTSTTSACLAAEEQVRWKVSDLSNVQTAGNNLSKVQSNGNWDGGAASWNTISNNGYFRFIASETSTARMAGISSTNLDANYTSIQYAFYLTNSGSLRIYELGNSQGTFGVYNTGDTLQIAIEANVVKYYQNSTLLYISTVAPTLPMLVDVSLNAIGSTITNAIVGNYNTGTFIATATNAGVSPSYQWKLNGTNTGTNSITYSNPGLATNDVVTCVLTPSLSGCGASTYTSNSITNKSVKSPISIDFYIQGAAAASACNTADEQVRWKISDLANVQTSGNSLSKLQSGGNWDGGAASFNTVANNGYFQFTATETNTYRMAGLSTTNANSSYTSIQYAIYLTNAGSLQIYESGTSRGSFGTYLTNDVLKIAVESNVVKYYQNGNLLYISAVAPTLPMLVDVSINSTTGTITNAIVSNFNTGVFTATATNAGVSPIYQWKLNGVNTGTNSTTYTNAALNANDVITCVLTPNLNGCTGKTYNSNSIINKSVAAPSSIDFYVKATTAATACNVMVEQVKWKTSDLLNVIPSTNNLSKLQSNGNWDGGAASWNTVSNNGYLQFNLGETNNYKAIGLSNTNLDANYTSIQYGFYLTNAGILQITESGTNRGSFSSYTATDTLKIAVESSVVKYYQNSILLYVSTVAPTLPLLVDVSIYNANATLKNVVVCNYSTGTFTGIATNAGASPTYQWKLNGVNTGTNSSTYTDITLTNNDIVTCVLTPNIAGCTGVTYTSNITTVKTPPVPSNVDFYISGNVGASACNSIAEEQVKWKTTDLSSNTVATTNNLNKIQSGGNWDGGAASWNTVSNNGYFQFTATEVTTARMAGLSTTNADANFTSIQYAIYLTNAGAVQIYESGAGRGTFGTYAASDVMKVAVESNVVKYYKNNVLLYVSGVVPTLPLLVDVSINTVNGTISNAVVGNFVTNTFTAAATNAGGSPSYQWKLNGTNVGTGVTYTNTALVAGDVVTCVLSTSVAGCGALTYSSNSIIEKLGPVPANLDFYIQGTAVSSSCNLSEEQVKWKISDLTANTVATSNNLYKASGTNAWDGGAASWNTVSNGGFLQFTTNENNRFKTVGLSTTNTNASNTTIQFGISLSNGGVLQIVESGTNKGTAGTYVANDVFKVSVESGIVKYYKNGTLFYTSLVVPTLPLLVDVSIFTVGATVTNALVSNYNNGAFTATAVNAGASPTYQWQLNGTNVGTGSTYTNASLVISDVVSCILTPNIAGCTLPVVNSNNITNKSTAAPAAVEFYILATAATAACTVEEEQVRWKVSDLVNVVASGNNLNKTTANGAWNGGAASWNTVSNNGYLQFTANETTKYRMIGLSNTNTDANFTTIQYTLYTTAISSVKIYESGVDRGTFGSYVTGDVFRIAVESSVVKYYKNGTLLYISSIAPTLPMLVDVSIYNTGGTISNAVVGNLGTGSFTAIALNAGVNPTYQWKLNGVNAGVTNSYSNTALAANDVVTCVLTPDLGACGLGTYNSNTITNKATTAPGGIDFYIQGTASASACNTTDEQVVWKVSDLTNVQASTNSLNKIQSGGNWDGGAASWNTVNNNGYFQFTATETNKSRMAGLSNTNANSDYTTIQYAVYLVSNSTFQIYESGSSRGTFGTYISGDVFKISVEASVVKYYQNGVVIYISSVVPTVPMLVDVSIQSNGGTVTNAIVSNSSLGIFTATATNAGASPTYQWKLNGVNTGTNSNTYTNTSLNNGDVVTCALKPNLGGCTLVTYTSNTITNKTVPATTGIDFYIQGTVATSACNTTEEQVRWKNTDLSNVQATGNNLNKIQSNSSWDGGAASWNTVSNNGYFQFTATETNKYRAVGLSSSNANSNYTSIQYAFYLSSSSTIQIQESGNYRGSFGTYAANDVFKVSVENSVVKYYKNGALLYISNVAPTLPMLVDVSIYNSGGTVTNAIVSNYNTGSFVATATNAGVSPTFQWKVNGSNVGTGTTYTNTALNLNDVITCVLTPNLGGCATTTFTSNSITEKVITNPTNLDFYIQGVVATSACNTVDEQVKWKISDLTNVQAVGNNLNKIQSNGNWDGGAASWNTVSNNGYFQFTATETNEGRMAGLSSSNTNSSYTTIQYAIYLLGNSTVAIYESGTSRGTLSTYVTGDVFKITVEAGVVKYYQNANLLYISTVAPVLPLLVDVSIRDVGGTITNALVSNYNTGLFSATTINAGASPSFQWKLNGVNVGPNSSSYTNTNLNANDIITCVLTPNLAGCNSTTYTSNSLTNNQVPAPLNLDFYIQGTVTTSACNTADEQVKWKVSDLNFVTATGNNLVKVQSNSTWDGGAASWNTVSNNGYFQFSISEANTEKVAGLSTSNLNSSNSSIQFGFYLTASSAINILESGSSRGSFGNYSNGDLLKIAVEANVVKYYKNNNLLYISTVAPVLPLLVDVSIRSVGGTITNAIVSNYNTGNFLATAINAGGAPVYQWKLNGTNVGTNTNTYSNPLLGNNDVITCVLTPSLGGCSTAAYASNSITNVGLNAPTSIDFYVLGSPVPSSCSTVDEQVRWKISDYQNVQGIGNNLTKIQSNGNWDGGAASWNTVSNNGYFQMTVAETNKTRIVGLSNTNANANYTSIQYGFYLASTSALIIIESNVSRGGFGSYAANDVLKIAVQNNIVKYYKNGTLIYTSGVAPTLPLLVDVSINNVGGTVANAIVSNVNNGTYTATATNAGVTPSYQWKLNGTNVGTNSDTYSNPSLTNNDVVTCVLTPNLPGCNGALYVSNTTIYRATTITTQPLSQAICTGGSTTLTVVASSNSLNYQWRKNGVNIVGAITSSYTIAAATAASAGNYDVIVNTGGCTSNPAVIAVSTLNQWSGATSTSWINATNWSCGIVPNAATDVIIPSAALNMPLISTSVSVNTLTLNTSSTLGNSGVLNLFGSLTNNGTYTDNGTTAFTGSSAQSITGATNFKNLTLNNTAGLTLNSTSTVKGVLTLTNGAFTTNDNLNVDLYNGAIAGTGTGTTTGNVRFFKTIWSNRYHYISSPIPGRTAADWNDNVIINFGANTNMYYYNETVPDTSVKVGWTGVTALSQPLQTMIGYALYFKAFPTTVLDVSGPYTHNLGTLSSGTLTNTKSTIPTFKPASDGWNHLGNPYPSTIDWNSAGWTKTGIDNAVYYWDPRNNKFGAYVAGVGTNGATQYIGSMQGFFVKVSTSGGTGSVSMTNAVRTAAIDVDVWRTASDGSTLRLTATSGTSSDETIVRLLDDATTTFDSEADAYKMMNEGQTPSLYTDYNADRYAVNTLPSMASNEMIPVNLDAKFAGTYTFSANVTGFEDADSLIFVDKLSNVRQDLRINPTYSCDLVKADYRNRFYIQYNKKASVVTDTKPGILSAITVFSFEQKVTVNFNNPKVSVADISIYDVKGNAVYKVKNQSVATGKVEINLPFVSSGIYIVKIESGQASKTQEVYIAK